MCGQGQNQPSAPIRAQSLAFGCVAIPTVQAQYGTGAPVAWPHLPWIDLTESHDMT
jgi:hypothetical protein